MGHAVAQAVIVAMVSAQHRQQLIGTKSSCSIGPTYCGQGCVSNCGAVAQCGQYADAADRDCPLNTCCSQYGFVSPRHASSLVNRSSLNKPQCGTTPDFCGSGYLRPFKKLSVKLTTDYYRGLSKQLRPRSEPAWRRCRRSHSHQQSDWVL